MTEVRIREGFGLCATPEFFPIQTELQQLRPPYLRTILYTLDDLQRVKSWNTPFILTINNQFDLVRGDWSGWDVAIWKVCETLVSLDLRDKCLVICAGNELDLYWHKNNLDVPPEFGADIARRAARIAHNYNIKVSATSLAGPRLFDYLAVLAHLCENDVDYFDVHPYGQKPNGWRPEPWMHGTLENIINSCRAQTYRPFIITEYGVKIRDAGDENQVATFLTAAYQTLQTLGIDIKCWFAYSDSVGAPYERGPEAFGLKSEQDTYRPAWYAFSKINEGVIVSPNGDNLDKWKPFVGTGLLDMMRADRTEPSMRSEWRPFDRPSGTPATIEYCIATNGVHYYWLLNEEKGYRLRPSP